MSSEVTAQQRVTVNWVRFSRLPDAPDGALRSFDAEVELADDVTGVRAVFGAISGWLGWRAWLPELVDSGQPIGTMAGLMAAAAIDVSDRLAERPDIHIETVLMVDQLTLVPKWVGTGMGRRVVEQVIDLLLLTPETTLVLAHLDRAAGVYRNAGFEQWQDSGIWWGRLGGVTRVAT
jgi:GNAT superfamily N-acetyltransferase